jgi:hypothetical protein
MKLSFPSKINVQNSKFNVQFNIKRGEGPKLMSKTVKSMSSTISKKNSRSKINVQNWLINIQNNKNCKINCKINVLKLLNKCPIQNRWRKRSKMYVNICKKTSKTLK